MITTTQIKIGEMLGDFKRSMNYDYEEALIVDYLAFTAMVIEEGKIKLC